MDSTTIVIYMTGLLLLTPATSRSHYPLHVLFPKPGETHNAEIGYYRQPNAPCDTSVGQICYVDLSGYSITLPDSGTSIARGRVHLGDGTINVSSFRHRVRRRYLEAKPDSMLRARVTLNEGLMTGSCALGTWAFRRHHVTMNNVLTWSMPNATVGNVTLRLRPLPYADSSSHPEREITLTPDTDGIVMLFIRHVSPSDTQVRSIPLQRQGVNMDHFHDLSVLLRAGQGGDAEPTLVAQTVHQCQWGDRGDLLFFYFSERAAGALSCMITSALPGTIP